MFGKVSRHSLIGLYLLVSLQDSLAYQRQEFEQKIVLICDHSYLCPSLVTDNLLRYIKKKYHEMHLQYYSAYTYNSEFLFKSITFSELFPIKLRVKPLTTEENFSGRETTRLPHKSISNVYYT